ncbi:MAG: hypothetical protein ACK4YP_17105, partial [Myxococcota bacterium]
MAFFGIGDKGVLDRALTSAWRTQEEKDHVLAQVRDARIKPVDAIPLLWHADPAARNVGMELFLAKPDGPALHELLERMREQPQHVRAFVGRLFGRVPADTMGKVVDDLLSDRSPPQKKRMGWEVALTLGGELRGKYLERAVKEAPVAVRVPALQRLVQERPPALLLDLLLSLARDPEPKVAGTALETVAQVQEPRVLD